MGGVQVYNESYLHSALGYRPPNRAEEIYNLNRKTLLKSAWLMGSTTV